MRLWAKALRKVEFALALIALPGSFLISLFIDWKQIGVLGGAMSGESPDSLGNRFRDFAPVARLGLIILAPALVLWAVRTYLSAAAAVLERFTSEKVLLYLALLLFLIARAIGFAS